MHPQQPSGLALEIEGLSFNYHGGPGILHDVNFKLERGRRCLLVGANGTGKSTVLQIMAGKRLTRAKKVRALGVDPFQQSPTGLTFLGSEWAQNPIVRKDIPVHQLIRSNGGDKYPERRDYLIDLLDVDPEWHMHQVSDGERRRVQLLLGLIEPWQLLLLDEVTVDLDVLVRRDLLQYLQKETDERSATIVYATHIFDGIGDWATDICHLHCGTVRVLQPMDTVPELLELRSQHQTAGFGDSPLLRLVEIWLRGEFEERKRKRKLHEVRAPNAIELKKEDRAYGDKYYDYWS